MPRTERMAEDLTAEPPLQLFRAALKALLSKFKANDRKTMMESQGYCVDEFEAVRDAFQENFATGDELGASVCVVHDGKVVVDLWGGHSAPSGEPWQKDTIVNVYSTTKTMAAVCMLMLADRGLVDFDAPVARYWPEFAQNGKEGVLVRHVMSHSAGLAGFDSRVEIEELYNWDDICSRLAGQAPWWEPGTASGYHAITQGYLQGEILRRVDGRSLGTFFHEEIATPLNVDFHIGLDPQHDDRVGEMVPPSSTMDQISGDPDSIATRTFRSAVLTGREPQTRAWRAAEIPAAGGIGNARAVARVHGAIAAGGALDGVRLMAPETVAMARQQQTNGKDLVLGVWMLFGLGFGLMNPRNPFTPSPGAFYWGGWGGSIAVVDPDTRTSIAYVMNRMGESTLGDQRSAGIIQATYASLKH